MPKVRFDTFNALEGLDDDGFVPPDEDSAAPAPKAKVKTAGLFDDLPGLDDTPAAKVKPAPKVKSKTIPAPSVFADLPGIDTPEVKPVAKPVAMSAATPFLESERLLKPAREAAAAKTAARRKADEEQVPLDREAGEEFNRQRAEGNKEGLKFANVGKLPTKKVYQTPEAFAAAKTGTERGNVEQLGDALNATKPLMQVVTEPLRRALTPGVAPRTAEERAGKRVRAAVSLMQEKKDIKALKARKDYPQLLATSKAALEAGKDLSEEQTLALASDKSFTAEAKRFAEGLKDDEFVGEMAIGFIEDLPLQLAAGAGIGAGLRVVQNAARVYKEAARIRAIESAAVGGARTARLAGRGVQGAKAATAVAGADKAGITIADADVEAAAAFNSKQGQVAERAVQAEKTRQALARTKRVLGKESIGHRAAEELTQNIGSMIAIDYPTIKAQGDEYGWGQLIQNATLGTAMSVATGGVGALRDKGISRKVLDKASDVATLAGAEAHPKAKEMIPLFAALADNPEFQGPGGYAGPRVRLSAEDRFISAEEGAKAYGIPLETFKEKYGDRVAVGGQTGKGKISKAAAKAGAPQKGEIRVWGKGDNATVVEEVTHHLQERLREKSADEGGTGPWSDLLGKMDDWEESVRAEARVRSEVGDEVALPAGDELFAQALAVKMGYAKDLPIALRRVVIPDDVFDGFSLLLGDEKALTGESFAKGDIQGLKNAGEPGVNRGEPGLEPVAKDALPPESYAKDDAAPVIKEAPEKVKPADESATFSSAGDYVFGALTKKPAQEGSGQVRSTVLYVHPDDLKSLNLEGTEASGALKASARDAWKRFGVPVKVSKHARRLSEIAEKFGEEMRQVRETGSAVHVIDVDAPDLDVITADDLVTALVDRPRSAEQRAAAVQAKKEKLSNESQEEALRRQHGDNWERDAKLFEADKILAERGFDEEAIAKMPEDERIEWYDAHTAEERKTESAAANLKPEVDEEPDDLPFNLKHRENQDQADLFAMDVEEEPEVKKVVAKLATPKAGAAAPEKAAPKLSKEMENLQDAGEKIGGARKDKWAQRGLTAADLEGMTGGEQAKFVTKTNIWKPDYSELVAAGVEPRAAAALKIIYDRLAAKPKADTPEGRLQYLTMMGHIKDVYSGAKTEADVAAARDVLFDEKLNWKDDWKDEARGLLFSVYKGRSEPFRLGYADRQKIASMLKDGFPEQEAWTRRYDVRDYSGGTGITEHGAKVMAQRAKESGDSWAADKSLEELEAEFMKTGKVFRVAEKGSGKWVAARPDIEGAKAAAREIYEGKKGSKESGLTPDRPHLDDLKREGPDNRKGRAISSEDFRQEFGFRGVEFGNWAASDERLKHVNQAYEALADLADVLGIPREAVSLNGTLGLAFGARGSHFRAHYEPSNLAINLAKVTGPGALAHEWGHALDHYLGELDRPGAYQGDARFGSGGRVEERYSAEPQMKYVRGEGSRAAMRLDNLRPEMAKAFDQVMLALFKRQKDKAEAIREAELNLERHNAEYGRTTTTLDKQKAKDPASQDKKWMKWAVDWLPKKKSLIESLGKRLVELNGEAKAESYGDIETSFLKDAKKLSGPSGDYWKRPTELFARAFEAYVYDRLGRQSDYLVHGVEESRFADPKYEGNPYPAGVERKAINAAFDRLFDTMESKKTEKGTALYNLKPVEEAGAPKGKENDPAWIARATKAWKEQGTESPFFKRWFGKSKVVGKDGKPSVVYHGSVSDFTEFKPGEALSGFGKGMYFTSSLEHAATYADPSRGEGGSLYPVYLKLENPASRADYMKAYGQASKGLGHESPKSSDISRLLANDGFDGVEIQARGDERIYVAFQPEQIKSAIGNRGTFNAKNPSILYNLKPGEVAGKPSDLKVPSEKRGMFTRMVDAIFGGQAKSALSNLTLRGVTDKEAALYRQVGFEAKGARHRVNRMDLQHALNNHGKGTNPGEAPLRVADIKRIPEIIDNPDAIRKGTGNVDGPSLVLIKQFPDGRIQYVVVGKWEDGIKILDSKTMWKEAPPPSPAKGELGNTATRTEAQRATGGPYEGGNPSSKEDVGTSQRLPEDGRPSPAPGDNIPPDGRLYNLKPGDEKKAGDARIRDYITQDVTDASEESGFLTAWEKHYSHRVEGATPIFKVQDLFEKEKGGALPPERNLKYLVDRVRGAKAIAEAYIDKNLTPIYKGLSVEQGHILDEYVVAMRTKWLYENKLTGGEDEFGNLNSYKDAGISHEAADKTIAEISKRKDFPIINDRAKALWKYNKDIADLMVKGGHWTPEERDIYAKEPFYVPFKRDIGAVGAKTKSDFGGSTKQFTSTNKLMQRIKGTGKQEIPIIDPLRAMVAQTNKTFSELAKARVWNSIVNLVKESKELRGWIEEVPVGTKPKADQELVQVIRLGEKQHFLVPKELGDAVNSLGYSAVPEYIRAVAALTNVFKRAATSWNIDFAINNLFRDQQDAAFNTGKIPFRAMLRGLYHYIKKDKIFHDYHAKGGGMDAAEAGIRKSGDKAEEIRYSGARFGKANDPDAFKGKGAETKRMLERLKKAARLPLDISAVVGEASEMMTRLGAYELALKKGKSQQEAVHLSRQLTDFNRIGSKMRDWNAAIPFLNAGIQGVDRLARTAKDDPARFAARFFLYAVAPATGLLAWNSQNPYYQQISSKEKETYWIMMLGKTTPNYIKLAKGHTQKILINGFQMMAENKLGTAHVKPLQLGVDALFSLSPISDVSSLLPVPLKVGVEEAINYDIFWNRKIVKDPNLAPRYQYDPNTSETLKMIGGALNLSPARLEHVTRGILAGSAGNILFLTDLALGKTDAISRPDRIPVIRRLNGVAEEWKSDLAERERELQKVIGQRAQRETAGSLKYREANETPEKMTEILSDWRETVAEAQKELDEVQAAIKVNNQLIADLGYAGKAASKSKEITFAIPTPRFTVGDQDIVMTDAEYKALLAGRERAVKKAEAEMQKDYYKKYKPDAQAKLVRSAFNRQMKIERSNILGHYYPGD